MKSHWTERSNRDFLYRIVNDFIGQIEKKMEKDNISQGKLAQKLRRSKGRISQLLNNPGNFSLITVIKLSRILGMKVSIVAYEDDDPANTRGPINPEIFTACWEKCKNPGDFWAVDKANTIEISFQHLHLYDKAGELEMLPARAENTAEWPPIADDAWIIPLGEENYLGRSKNYYFYSQRSR